MQLRFRGNPKQIEAARRWTDKQTVEIVYGGAKYGGKSFLGANLIFCDALIYPDTFYFIARQELNDIRKFTIPSIHLAFKKWGIKLDDYCKYNGQDNFFEIRTNGSRVYLLECGYTPKDPLYERFGSMEMTRGWIEEGGEVHVLAKENLKASIGRKNNDHHGLRRKLLITCNPKKNWLYSEFYKPHTDGKLSPDKAFIKALPTDNVFGSKEYIDSLGNLKDATMKQRLFFGNWEYDDDPTCLIEYEKIIDLFTNTFVKAGLKYITADIARFGSDKTIIIIWDGWKAVEIIELSKSSITDTATKISELAKARSIPRSQIIVDEDGVGGGVKDILQCVGFVNNSSPIVVQGAKDNFTNLKSQCYFLFSERVNSSGVFINTKEEQQKKLIIEELENVKRKSVDTDGKLAVQPKEWVKDQIGRSPDYSDTLMMREYFELKPKTGAPRILSH
jgi:phage terminase large subunit